FSTNERCWLHGIDCVWPYCQLYGRARESFSDFWNGVSTRVKSRSRNWFCFWCCCSRCHCLFLFFFLAPFFLRFSTKAWGFCICTADTVAASAATVVAAVPSATAPPVSAALIARTPTNLFTLGMSFPP